MARSKTPAVTSIDVTHLLATAKPSTCGAAHIALVATYGEAVADRFAASDCKRLPRHGVTAEKGHVTAKPNGLLTAKQREARKASLVTARKAARVTKPKVVAHRTITLGGTKFLVTLGRDGSAVLTKVAAPKVASTPDVTVIAEAESTRQVAAPAKIAHTRRHVTSGQPSARLA